MVLFDDMASVIYDSGSSTKKKDSVAFLWFALLCAMQRSSRTLCYTSVVVFV